MSIRKGEFDPDLERLGTPDIVKRVEHRHSIMNYSVLHTLA
jgi:hypothetical protein